MNLEPILGPRGPRHEEAKYSLFIVSAKAPRLKKVDLRGLSSEERAEKLHRWAKDHRFVAVIETSQMVYAHAHADFAAQLQGQNLSINGKNVSVKALTEEDSEKLSIVGETFEDFVREHPEEDVVEKEQAPSSLYQSRQYFASRYLLSDEMRIDYFIAQMENIPHKIIIAALQRMNDVQREIAKRQEEKAIQDDQRRSEIRQTIIRKEMLKDEIKEEQIERQNQKLDWIEEEKRKKA